MTEPILSRDQILKIVRKTLKENNDRDKLSAQRFVEFAAASEAAVLEEVCWEPIYQTRWTFPHTFWGDVPKDDYDNHQVRGYADRRIVYALTRSTT